MTKNGRQVVYPCGGTHRLAHLVHQLMRVFTDPSSKNRQPLMRKGYILANRKSLPQ